MKKNRQKYIAGLALAFYLFQTVTAYSLPVPQFGEEIFLPSLPIEIPEEYAKVDDIYQSPGKTPSLIIHISDAHGNYEAQKNIQALIKDLNLKHKVRLLFLEAGNGPLEPKLLRFFKKKSLNLKVADELMRNGQFSGAEAFLLENPSLAKGFGIEDVGTYRRDLNLFRRVLTRNLAAVKALHKLEASARLLESHYFSPELRDFMKEWRGYRDGEHSLMRFIPFLNTFSKNYLQLDLSDPKNQKDFPSLIRILKLRALESKLDGVQAKKETEALILEFKAGEGTHQDLIGRLRNLDKEKFPRFLLEQWTEAFGDQIDFKKYPDFTRYAQHLILKSEIDSAEFFSETDQISEKLMEALTTTGETKTLVRLIRELYELEKFFQLEVNREEYEALVSARERLSGEALLGSVQELSAKLPEIKLDPDWTEADARSINRLFGEAVDFYQLAYKREEHFLEKTFEVMKAEGETVAIMVTGGFHSQGIRDKLREKKISYVAVSPRIHEMGDSKEVYLNAILGKTKVKRQEEKGKSEKTKETRGSGIANVLELMDLGLQERMGAFVAERKDLITSAVLTVGQESGMSADQSRSFFQGSFFALAGASLGQAAETKLVQLFEGSFPEASAEEKNLFGGILKSYRDSFRGGEGFDALKNILRDAGNRSRENREEILITLSFILQNMETEDVEYGLKAFSALLQLYGLNAGNEKFFIEQHRRLMENAVKNVKVDMFRAMIALQIVFEDPDFTNPFVRAEKLMELMADIPRYAGNRTDDAYETLRTLIDKEFGEGNFTRLLNERIRFFKQALPYLESIYVRNALFALNRLVNFLDLHSEMIEPAFEIVKAISENTELYAPRVYENLIPFLEIDKLTPEMIALAKVIPIHAKLKSHEAFEMLTKIFSAGEFQKIDPALKKRWIELIRTVAERLGHPKLIEKNLEAVSKASWGNETLLNRLNEKAHQLEGPELFKAVKDVLVEERMPKSPGEAEKEYEAVAAASSLGTDVNVRAAFQKIFPRFKKKDPETILLEKAIADIKKFGGGPATGSYGAIIEILELYPLQLRSNPLPFFRFLSKLPEHAKANTFLTLDYLKPVMKADMLKLGEQEKFFEKIFDVSRSNPSRTHAYLERFARVFDFKGFPSGLQEKLRNVGVLLREVAFEQIVEIFDALKPSIHVLIRDLGELSDEEKINSFFEFVEKVILRASDGESILSSFSFFKAILSWISQDKQARQPRYGAEIFPRLTEIVNQHEGGELPRQIEQYYQELTSRGEGQSDYESRASSLGAEKIRKAFKAAVPKASRGDEERLEKIMIILAESRPVNDEEIETAFESLLVIFGIPMPGFDKRALFPLLEDQKYFLLKPGMFYRALAAFLKTPLFHSDREAAVKALRKLLAAFAGNFNGGFSAELLLSLDPFMKAQISQGKDAKTLMNEFGKIPFTLTHKTKWEGVELALDFLPMFFNSGYLTEQNKDKMYREFADLASFLYKFSYNPPSDGRKQLKDSRELFEAVFNSHLLDAGPPEEVLKKINGLILSVFSVTGQNTYQLFTTLNVLLNSQSFRKMEAGKKLSWLDLISVLSERAGDKDLLSIYLSGLRFFIRWVEDNMKDRFAAYEEEVLPQLHALANQYEGQELKKAMEEYLTSLESRVQTTEEFQLRASSLGAEDLRRIFFEAHGKLLAEDEKFIDDVLVAIELNGGNAETRAAAVERFSEFLRTARPDLNGKKKDIYQIFVPLVVHAGEKAPLTINAFTKLLESRSLEPGFSGEVLKLVFDLFLYTTEDSFLAIRALQAWIEAPFFKQEEAQVFLAEFRGTVFRLLKQVPEARAEWFSILAPALRSSLFTKEDLPKRVLDDVEATIFGIKAHVEGEDSLKESFSAIEGLFRNARFYPENREFLFRVLKEFPEQYLNWTGVVLSQLALLWSTRKMRTEKVSLLIVKLREILEAILSSSKEEELSLEALADLLTRTDRLSRDELLALLEGLKKVPAFARKRTPEIYEMTALYLLRGKADLTPEYFSKFFKAWETLFATPVRKFRLVHLVLDTLSQTRGFVFAFREEPGVWLSLLNDLALRAESPSALRSAARQIDRIHLWIGKDWAGRKDEYYARIFPAIQAIVNQSEGKEIGRQLKVLAKELREGEGSSAFSMGQADDALRLREVFHEAFFGILNDEDEQKIERIIRLIQEGLRPENRFLAFYDLDRIFSKTSEKQRSLYKDPFLDLLIHLLTVAENDSVKFIPELQDLLTATVIDEDRPEQFFSRFGDLVETFYILSTKGASENVKKLIDFYAANKRFTPEDARLFYPVIEVLMQHSYPVFAEALPALGRIKNQIVTPGSELAAVKGELLALISKLPVLTKNRAGDAYDRVLPFLLNNAFLDLSADGKKIWIGLLDAVAERSGPSSKLLSNYDTLFNLLKDAEWRAQSGGPGYLPYFENTVLLELAGIIGEFDGQKLASKLEKFQKKFSTSTPPFEGDYGASLGEDVPVLVEKFLRGQGRVSVASTLKVAGMTDAGGIADGVFYLPGAANLLVKWYEAQLGLNGPEARELPIGVRAFNQDLSPFLEYLASKGSFRQISEGKEPETQAPIIVFEEVLRGSENETDTAARRIADAMRKGDLLLAVWDGKDQASGMKPRIISRLYELAAGKFRVRDVRKELASASFVRSATRNYSLTPITVSPLSQETLELEWKGEMSRVRLDLKLLAQNGIDPAQVVALLRQLADYPSLRRELFLQAGLEERQGYWEVGQAFVQLLLDTIYTEQAAQQALARAA